MTFVEYWKESEEVPEYRAQERRDLLAWVDSRKPINWSKVSNYLKKQGYDSRGPVDAEMSLQKNPFVLTNPDWKEAIIYGSTKIERTADPFLKAKRYFGLTTNFGEVGYLLPDGKMLDFSLKNQGGTPGKRAEDHNAIAGYFPDEYEDKFQVMRTFGPVRMFPEQGGFSIHKAPTPEQRKVLSKYLDYFRMDKDDIRYIDVEDGKRRTTLEYSGKTSPFVILKDIDDFYSGKDFENGND